MNVQPASITEAWGGRGPIHARRRVATKSVTLLSLLLLLLPLTACRTPRSSVDALTLSETVVVVPIAQGHQVQATLTVTGSPNQTLLWQSLNQSVATVEDGWIIGVAAGETEVEATSVANPDISASVAVVVVAPPSTAVVPPPGADAVFIDGQPVDAVRDVGTDRITYTIGTLEFTLIPHAQVGPLGIASDGILRIPSDGLVEVSGSGFAPERVVLAWFLSDPQLFGSVWTDAAGAFHASFPLPALSLLRANAPLAATPHALIFEGENDAGGAVSLIIGIEIVGPSDEAAVISVHIEPSGLLEVAVGATQQLQALVSVLADASTSVAWTTSDANIATVSDTGLVTKLANGAATITATSLHDPDRWASVTVLTPEILSVSLTPAGSISLPLGGWQQFSAHVAVLGSLSDAVVWGSSDSAIALVDEEGLVEKVALGTATITATSVADPTQLASASVYTPAITGVAISPSGTLTLGLSQRATLTASTEAHGGADPSVTWSSSEAGVADVTGAGLVSAHAYGTAIVTATSTFDPSVSASVTVVVDPFAHCPLNEALYVDASAVAGDGSRAAPVATLAAAIGLAEPGDTLCVAPGTYPETQIIINKAVTVLGPFTGVAAFEPMRGGTEWLTVPGEAVLVNGVRLTAAGAYLAGVSIAASGSQISAANLTLADARILGGAGDYPNYQNAPALLFSIAGDNLTFEGNYIRGFLTAIFVQGSSSHLAFLNNRFEGNYTALSGDGTVNNLVYTGNAFVRNHRAISYAPGAAAPIAITDNTFDNNTRGVMFRAAIQTGANLTVSGNRFVNMTGETVDAGNFGGVQGSIIFDDFVQSIAGTSLNGNWWGQATGPKPSDDTFGGQVRLTPAQADELELTTWCSEPTCAP
jgi:uncharacterized protein YjdB